MIKTLFRSAAGAVVLLTSFLPPGSANPAAEPGAERPSGVQLSVTRHVLDNGMVILLVPRREAPVVATYLRFGVGGVDDPKGQTGIAHLLEHMMFKGTKSFGTTDYEAEVPLMKRLDELWEALDRERSRSQSPFAEDNRDKIHELEAEIEDVSEKQRQFVVKNELWQIYQRCGGVGLNASTGNDSTQYYVELPSNQLELWAACESDRILNPVFREFYSERDVVHEERRLRTDSQPRGLFREAFQQTAFSAHPYRQPVVGWPSDIDGTERREVLAYFKTYYAPNNCIAALVGDLDVESTITLMKKYFGPIPRKETPRRHITTEPRQRGERRLVMTLDSAPSLTMAWHAPAAGHPDADALNVASQVLSGSRGGAGGRGRGGRRGGRGGGSSGRFAKALVRGREVALNVSASFRPALYPSLFTVSATPAPGIDLEELEEAVIEELERLTVALPTEEELSRVRNGIEARAIRSLGSNTGIARALANAEALAGDWRYVDTERERLKAVTAADIARVVKTYFTSENRTVGYLRGTPRERSGRGRRGPDGRGPSRRSER